MKKINLLFVIVLAFAQSLNAQEISFSFTGNHTCMYAPLDSVLVENLAQGGDTVLYFPDTVLNIVLTGIDINDANEDDFYLSQNYPNPFSSKTKIDVFVPGDDEFRINIFDITGRQIVNYENHLERGLHNFTFTAGNSTNYVLTVNSDKFLQKILMIRVGSNKNAKANFSYNGIMPESKSLQKSERSKSTFLYEIGDELKFTGYIDGDFEEITDAPTTNEDYVFNINDITPEAPVTISGNIHVCENASGKIYNIASVDDATSYIWTVPTGATIVSGQGTTEITVNFGTSSGNLCVAAQNICGVGPATCQTITVNNPVPGISGNYPVCEGNTIQLEASPSGMITYGWSGPDGFVSNNENPTIPSATPSASGTYSLTVTDSYGCTGTISESVMVYATPTAIAGSNSPVCEGEDIHLTETGGDATEWDWNGPDGFTSNAENPVISSAAMTDVGTYWVTVTNANGCSNTSDVDVTVNATPAATAESNSPVCDGEDISLSETGGDASEWSWSGPDGFTSNVESPGILDATTSADGIYYVTVTAVNGCTNTSDVDVTVNATPAAIAESNSPVCDGEDVYLSETGGDATSWSWSGPDGFTSSLQNSSILNATTDANGIYYVTVTDANSCTNTAYVDVTVNETPIAIAGSNSPLSVGEDILLTENGGDATEWSWSGPSGFSSNSQNPTISSATIEASGTYTVNITDANGCTASDQVMVTVTEGPIADAGDDQTICVGGSIEIGGNPTASGGILPYSFAWSPSNGLSNPSVANPTASPASTTTYIVTVTDGNSNTDADTVTVTVSEPTPSISYNDPVCDGGVLDLEGLPSGMASYNWEGPDGFASTGENPSIVDVTTASSGTYYITVTDNYGCTGATSTDITINDSPTADAGNEETICIGESIGIGGSPTASGGSGSGYTYAWSPASGLSSSSDANPDATPDTTTTYTVTVTDGNGCTASDTVLITVNDPNAQATSNSPVCANDQIELYGNPGGMVTYEWSGAAWQWWQEPEGQNQTINNAGSGDEGWYELTVEDNNGCVSTSSVYVFVITDDPNAPLESSHTVGPDSILWRWNAVSTASGYKYNTTDNYGSATDIGTDTSFLQTGLNPGTPYSLYVWAYDNCGGTSNSVELTAVTESSGPFVCGDYLIDTRDGTAYETMEFGNQCWMVENLNYASHASGNSWCYDDDPSNCDTYGRLYDWDAAMEGGSASSSNPSGVQGICPDGWHLPSDDEWKELEGEVDATYDYGDSKWDNEGCRGDDVGSALAGNASLWTDGNLEDHSSFGTSGFNALPGGRVTSAPSSTGLSQYAYWWTTDESTLFTGNAYFRSLYYQESCSTRGSYDATSGLSVRCVKD